MKTKMRKQSLPKRKKIPSELVPNRPPVGDRWELLGHRTERQTRPPLGSTKSSFAAPGCGVDSQCAWYKISVRSLL